MEMVNIKSFNNYFSANIILAKLQDAGISCYLADETTSTLYPVLANAIGGIKLMVGIKDAEEASILLDKFEKEYLLSIKCPNCGSYGIIAVSKPGAKNFITAILTWLFSSYAIEAEKVYQCQHCNYESKTLPEDLSLTTGDGNVSFSEN